MDAFPFWLRWRFRSASRSCSAAGQSLVRDARDLIHGRLPFEGTNR